MRFPNLPEVLLEDVLGREDSLSDALVGVIEGNLETISDGKKDDGKQDDDAMKTTSETFLKTSR